MKVKGIDKLSKEFATLAKNARKLSGQQSYSFDEIFTQDFMSKHTNFNTIENFLSASPEKISTQEEFETADETLLDTFVSQQTKFKNWKEMLNKASEELIVRRLGL